jgi:phosphoenolpyruvate carboxykinase (GTP)
VGRVRRDPFAMRPFCGYHMGDYFRHWIKMQRSLSQTPRIFHVNWFRKSAEGKFLWPGFSDNSRALKWMCERVDGTIGARETPVGLMPEAGDLDLSGLDIAKDNMKALMDVDLKEWKAEVLDIENHFALFSDRLPARLKKQLEEMKKRLG